MLMWNDAPRTLDHFRAEDFTPVDPRPDTTSQEPTEGASSAMLLAVR
jgi:hypothetical protein